MKKHKLGVFAVAGTIYTFCCSGAYGIEDMIPSGGPGMTILALCVLPFIWAYPQAMICSELGSAIPEEGGVYIWVQRAFGEFWGFQAGYWLILINYLFEPTLIILAGDYVGTAFGWSWGATFAFKAGLILFFGYINWRGITDVSFVSTGLAIIVFLAFMCLIVIGATHWQYNPLEPFIPEGESVWMSAGYAFVIGMWMYGGYSQMGNVAGELENPQVIPKALMIALPLSILTYIPTTIVGLASYGQWEDWGTDGVSWVAVAGQAGPIWAGIFVVIAFLGQVSLFNSYLGTSARTIFVMAFDNLAPKIFTRCSKKTGVPDVALLSIIITSLILCTFEFSIIVTLTVTVIFLESGVMMLAAMILRKTEPDMPRPFKVGMPDGLFSAMCIMVVAVCFIFLFLNGTDYFVFGMVVALSGPFLFWLLKKSYGGIGVGNKNVKALSYGDMKPIAVMFFLCAALSVIGFFFFPLYDDPYFFEDIYGIPGIFNIFITLIGIMAVVSAVFGIIFYRTYKSHKS